MCQPHNIPATGAQGTGGGSAHTRTEKWIFWGQNIRDFSGICAKFGKNCSAPQLKVAPFVYDSTFWSNLIFYSPSSVPNLCFKYIPTVKTIQIHDEREAKGGKYKNR